MDRRSFLKLATAAGISVVYTPAIGGPLRGHALTSIVVDEFPYLQDPLKHMTKPGTLSLVTGNRQTDKTSFCVDILSACKETVPEKVNKYFTYSELGADNLIEKSDNEIEPHVLDGIRVNDLFKMITKFAEGNKGSGVIVLDLGLMAGIFSEPLKVFNMSTYPLKVEELSCYKELRGIAVDSEVAIVLIQDQLVHFKDMMEFENIYNLDRKGFEKSKYGSVLPDLCLYNGIKVTYSD